MVEEVGGEATVIAGTGSYDTADSIALTQVAEKTGVDGVMLVAPYYNKPSQEGLALGCEAHPVREGRNDERLACSNLHFDRSAEAAAELARAARVGPKFLPPDQQRRDGLDHFGGRGCDPTGKAVAREAVLGRPGPHASRREEHCDEPVRPRTPHGRQPDVARPLGNHPVGDDRAEGPEHRVRQEMTDDVPGRHGGGEPRIQDASLRGSGRDGAEAAVVVRHFRPDGALQCIAGIRGGVVEDDVHAPVDLARSELPA